LEEYLDMRREKARRLLGVADPRCARCGESEILVLTGTHPNVLCYECQALDRGRSLVEDHHPAGKSVDPAFTVPVPGNDHRVLSVMQDDWPQATRSDHTGSPLLHAAAYLRGWLDVLRRILDRLDEIPMLLEDLNGWLATLRGERWWEQFARWRRRPK
jgi:hypothetical protein